MLAKLSGWFDGTGRVFGAMTALQTEKYHR
jgi:hypothetical protein